MGKKHEILTGVSPDAGMPSAEEFGGWLAADSANHDHFHFMVQRSIDRGYSQSSAESPDKSEVEARHAKAKKNLESVGQKATALMRLMKSPDGKNSSNDRRLQSNALMDEIIDVLSDTPEPYRALFLTEMYPVKGRLRAAWIEGD
jgi:hypothetical protein